MTNAPKSTPTLNGSYNALLAKWGTEPSCEECGCDLADRNVIDTGVSWVCASCHEDVAGRREGPPAREDFHSDIKS